jgi:hypothetical protein
MPKHAIRIPALRAGRRIRWMFEVFADVGEGVVRTQKTLKTRSKRMKKASRLKTRRKSLAAAAVLSPSTAASSTTKAVPVTRFKPATAWGGNMQMSPQASQMPDREVLGAVVIGVVVAVGVTIALAGYPSFHIGSAARNPSAAGGAQPEVHSQPVPVHVAAPVREAVAPAYVPKATAKPRPTPVVATRSSAPASVPSTPAVTAPTLVGSAGPDPVALERTTGAIAPERSTSALAAAATDAANHAVTISGCLEMTVDENQFRLSDTEGADAPRARSWKSGFLKKGSTPVELVEFSDAPTLRKYVGHRITATGVLTGRQLRVRSVQSAGSSCD